MKHIKIQANIHFQSKNNSKIISYTTVKFLEEKITSTPMYKQKY